MKTTEKLQILKEVLASSFLNATEKSISAGLQFNYISNFCEDVSNGKAEKPVKGWSVQIKVKELGYDEKIIQEFLYQKPDNIEIKNMEYHVLIDVISNLTQGCLISWFELAKYLNTDKKLQKEIIDGKKSSFTGNKQ
jgi:hypothetical protein